ncbi:MAG: hypothetical protein JEY91_12010 [Spirochaetaceae bacterium]|nr:hypothetical protein [Spirochaetaceae bacterium]
MISLDKKIKSLVLSHFEGVKSSAASIRTRNAQRGDLLRFTLDSGETLVVKLWKIRSMKERVKLALHISNGRREWEMHKAAHNQEINVPKPLNYQILSIPDDALYEVMTISDLGDCISGEPFINQMKESGENDKIASLETFIIETTLIMVKKDIFDIDNQLDNYLVDKNGGFWRIDFECARRRYNPFQKRKDYAIMLERLLRSHLHAVHPDSKRTTSFMSRMVTELSVPKKIRKMVLKISEKELQKEKLSSNINYEISLNW